MERDYSAWQLSDKLVVGIVAVVVTTLVLRQPAVGGNLTSHTAIHIALLAGFLIYRIWVRARLASSPGWRVAHDFVTLSVLLILYLTLAAPTFLAIPWTVDAILARADIWLFAGVSPSLMLQGFESTPLTESLSAVYAFFVPYLYLSIFVGLACRPQDERRAFVNGAAIVYAVSFLGYLFAPAKGPVVEFAGQFDAALAGGFFHGLVVDSVARAGGPHGVFPSLHVAVSLYLCLFDLRHNRLRGLGYLPLVLAIMLATVYLRYHWVVDVLAGIAIASLGFALATHRFRWARRDPSADLPLTYRLVRLVWYVAVRIVWFRRCETQGAQHLPAFGPVLICANHRNSLVDAFALIAMVRRPIVLTAKDTLRRNLYLKLFIKLHGIITFHRRQDRGADVDPVKNIDAVEQCLEKLAAGSVLCLFPEGVSHSDPDMRAFQGGAARLVAEYSKRARKSGWPELAIMPVGLNYDDKSRIRSNLLINFGTPLYGSDLVGDELDAERLTASRRNEITGILRREIDALTVNFETKRQAVAVAILAELAMTGTAPPPMLGLAHPPLEHDFAILKRLAEAPSLGAGPTRRILTFSKNLRADKVAVQNVFLPLSRVKAAVFGVREAELMLIAGPVALWGLIAHAIPLVVLWAITVKLSRDEDQWAANFLAPGFTALPLWYVVTCAVIAFLAGPWFAFAYLVSVLFGGYVALLYVDRIDDAFGRARTYFLFRRRPELQRNLQAKMTAILDERPTARTS